MKRGLDLEGIHFYSPPFTSERSKQKVLDISEKLAKDEWAFSTAYCTFYRYSATNSKTDP